MNEILVGKSLSFKLPRESNELEYKTCSFELPQNFWETVSSFSNTKGGYIILGVKENKRKKEFEIVGVDTPEDVITQLFNDNNNGKKISNVVINDEDVEVYKNNKRTLIQVYIHEAQYSQKPIYLNNDLKKAYIRTDDGDRLATDEQLKSMIANSNNDIDGELLENYDLYDLNLEDIRDYKHKISERTGNDVTDEDDLEFLKDVGVFRRDRRNSDKKYKLTAGGLLFFGKYNSIIQKFPSFQLDYFHYNNAHKNDWDDRVSSGDMNFPSLNIYSFYKISLQKLILGVSDKFQQDEEHTRGSYYSDLTDAVKEALVNVLMHSYYGGEGSIKIVDRNYFFEFSNPGEMRVTLDSFVRGSNSICRNSVIATLFRKIGISERAGSGGPRIMKSAKDNHLHQPDVENKPFSTLIRIWKIDKFTSLKVNNLDLTEDEDKILKIAVECEYFTKSDVVGDDPDEIKTSYRARNALNSLIDKKIINRKGKGKATKYILNMSDKQSKIESIRKFKEEEEKRLK